MLHLEFLQHQSLVCHKGILTTHPDPARHFGLIKAKADADFSRSTRSWRTIPSLLPKSISLGSKTSNFYKRIKAFSYTTALETKAAKQSHSQTLKRNDTCEGKAEFQGVRQSWVKHFHLKLRYFKQKPSPLICIWSAQFLKAVVYNIDTPRQIFFWWLARTAPEEAANPHFKPPPTRSSLVRWAAGNALWNDLLPGHGGALRTKS